MDFHVNESGNFLKDVLDYIKIEKFVKRHFSESKMTGHKEGDVTYKIYIQ